jgi:two-component system OmpR family sensor kinase
MGTHEPARRRVHVTLRLRLVLALGLLLAVGLTTFGISTYAFYSHSQYQRLDDQLRNAVPVVTRQLTENTALAGRSGGPEPGGHSGGPPKGPAAGPPVVAPSGTFAQLRDANGGVVNSIQLGASSSQPRLPNDLPSSQFFTVGSASGSGQWRAYHAPAQGLTVTGYTTVVATPTSEVTASLQRLVLIEALAALALLAALSSGSWLILRHGLRPLERMAYTARSINTGDLSQRVTPANGRGEVGQLGLALNSMLGEIEAAFAERQATEQRLRQFLADASHELRTPLTSIQGFAELFRLGADNEHVDQRVIVRRIEEESARMKTLVEDLLLLARLDQPRAAQRVPVDLAVLAADACSDAVAIDPERPITLDAPVPVVVSGDGDHLRQAVTNLVSNALKHTPPGSAIEVGAHVRNGRAVVSVRDHGAGLGADALKHVFDRFWQADRARVGTGSGLGLSITAGIAHEHGGAATAANHPGGGASFTIELPLSLPEPAEAARSLAGGRGLVP